MIIVSIITNNERNEHFENIPANNSVPSIGSIFGTDLNPLNKGDQASAEPTAATVLKPVCPDPDSGFERLSDFQVVRITKCTIKHMCRLCRERDITLDLEYWEKTTHDILRPSTTEDAIIVPAPAGSGKSTWIQAFHLALKDLFMEDSMLDKAIVGTVIVLQKVSSLNSLAAALNEGSPEDKPFMVALQGWNVSGKQLGYCLNSDVNNYDECPRNRCPYASQCPVLQFREKAPLAPVVGLTQERFYLLRQDNLSSVLTRIGQDGLSHPRRFIIFDEKYEMAPAVRLSMKEINEASTEFTKLISQVDASDTRVRTLQQRLSYSVEHPFQQIRRRQRSPDGVDVPVGFLRMPEHEFINERLAYSDFRSLILEKQRQYMSKPLSAVLAVMDCLYNGDSCLFTKANGFSIFRIEQPQLHFGQCQTVIFDATAQVDHDYSSLEHVRFLEGVPECSDRVVHFHLYTHRDMNVSRAAMENGWKLSAMAEFTAELIRKAKGKVFLCCYKNQAETLAVELREQLAKKDFSKILLMQDREDPTKLIIPYLDGNNGSNAFKDAVTVILLGYPRLNPETYLARAGAAYGLDQLEQELAQIPEEQLLNKRFMPWDIPSVRTYEAHHLAARLEQEIYRCAHRKPDFAGIIDIHLCYPPKDTMDILLSRIPGEVYTYKDLPSCVARQKGAARRFEDGPTSLGRLIQYIDQWDGHRVQVCNLRDELDISPSVWKDLMADPRVRSLLGERGITREGRGPNATWHISNAA